MRNRYFVILLLLLITIQVEAREMSDVLKDIPQTIMPTINRNSRLDMIDLYQAGMHATSPTLLGDTAQILVMGDTYIKLRTSRASTMQIKQLGKPKKPMYAIVTTVEAPVAHSHIELYNYKWEVIATTKQLPSITIDNFVNDSVVGEARADLLGKVRVRTIQYNMCEENDDLILLPSFLLTLDTKVRKEIAPFFAEKLTLYRKGKKWVEK